MAVRSHALRGNVSITRSPLLDGSHALRGSHSRCVFIIPTLCVGMHPSPLCGNQRAAPYCYVPTRSIIVTTLCVVTIMGTMST